MLTSTFIHAPGIGPATEKLIWDSGTTDWQQFMKCHGEIGLSPCQLSMLLPTIEDSIDHYDAEDFEYFARKLPSREHWRAFGELGSRAAYLDIETTGTWMGAGITVIGLYDGIDMKSFIKGFNLEDFAEEVAKYPLLVTYAGGSFDLPHLRHAFPGVRLDQLHLDLSPTLRRLGYKGGLKRVEKVLGVSRSDGVQGLDGWDAVRLWREWEDGSRAALDTLVEYNRADVVNLKQLAEFAYDGLRRLHLPPHSKL